MELIANLEKSCPARTLTPENLDRVEQVFKKAVGNEKEIDLENFKKIVQSKNMFFVERTFHVFDADNSGSISLEEFMRVMRDFAKQSTVEKLQYLFKMYDLNNDGAIQFEELRNVISECMKENGLRFEEEEIDELTRMLFEDADTDGSGAINFTEFKNQLEKQPAFMENLTYSIERWLLPPMEDQVQSKNRPTFSSRKINIKHIRNNWTSFLFLFIFFVINLILFLTRAYQYRDHNVYVILARACGQCLNFTSAFIVLPVLRQTLTWLRTHGYSKYFPIDHHIYYHKLTGCIILFYSLLHTAMHIANFNVVSHEKNITLPELLFTTRSGIGWVGASACITGWILLIIYIVLFISAMPFVRRSGKFEVFYILHMLCYFYWICLILHGPSFWKWFLGPAVLFGIESAIRFSRNLSNARITYAQQGVLLPSKVIQLVIKRPHKFDYRPGDYVFVCIPTIAKYEWHPFTISSAPELDEVIWLHIRGVGEWTNSLYNYFQKEEEDAVLSDELAKHPEDLPDFIRRRARLVDPRGGLYSDSSADSRSVSNKHHGLVLDTTFTCFTPEQVGNGSTGVVATTFANPTFCSEESPSSVQTVIEMDRKGGTPESSWKRTSLASSSASRAIQRKNKQDIRSMLEDYGNANRKRLDASLEGRRSLKAFQKEKRRSVRVSVARRGLRRCQTVIVMPTVQEDEDEEPKISLEKDNLALATEEEMKDLKREADTENVIVTQQPLKILLDGPYGSPTRHIFQARHAVLIATGIGVTPFASILQSIMYQYRKSRHTCPSCSHKWSDPLPVSSLHLKKVDFFWLNRHQRAFEWFVSLLSELEVEQAQLEERDRFLDIHMYITSALHRTDMKAVGLQMALDLLYNREKRDLITGLKSRTQPGRPDWNKVFTSIAAQQKGKVTVFFCGPNELARTLHTKCDEFGFHFRKEIF